MGDSGKGQRAANESRPSRGTVLRSRWTGGRRSRHVKIRPRRFRDRTPPPEDEKGREQQVWEYDTQHLPETRWQPSLAPQRGDPSDKTKAPAAGGDPGARAPWNARARGGQCGGPRLGVGKGRPGREAPGRASREAGASRPSGRSRAPTGGGRKRLPRRPRCPPLRWGGSRSRCSRLRRPPASGALSRAGARARSLCHPPAPAPAPAPAAAPPPPPTFSRRRHHRHFLLCFPLLSSPSVDYQVSARL